MPFVFAVKNPTRTASVLAIVTAYSSREVETDSTPYLTAHLTPVRKGIAACPRKIPFHTEVIIAGQIYTCEDRMAQRYRNGNYFDIWKSTTEEAYEFGRQELEVSIK